MNQIVWTLYYWLEVFNMKIMTIYYSTLGQNNKDIGNKYNQTNQEITVCINKKKSLK